MNNFYGSENNPQSKPEKETKMGSLLSFFSEKNKEELIRLSENIDPEAEEFFDVSVNGLLGHMPNELAETIVTMSKGGLKQLLYSAMVTGYVTKSIEHKLSLEKLLNPQVKESDFLVEKFIKSSTEEDELF